MAGYHPKMKAEPDSGDDRDPSRRPPPLSPSIPIADVMTANENWRGKNDPAERRRIQNRLNQRAFRQRQRAGESPKPYKSRSPSGFTGAQREDESEDETESPQLETSGCRDGLFAAVYARGHIDNYTSAATSALASASASARPNNGNGNDSTTNRPSGVTDADTGQVWDELARLINRNFLSAAVTNAQHIGVNLQSLQSGTYILTPRPDGRRTIPATLKPVDLQYQVAHDPIIDTIPHPRLRLHVLHAIATRQIDAAAFSRSIRTSGALEEQGGGGWQRGGVVVWSSPEQAVDVASWELSEPFVRRWLGLLQGCEDLVAGTNAWRQKRGERLFPTPGSQR